MVHRWHIALLVLGGLLVGCQRASPLPKPPAAAAAKAEPQVSLRVVDARQFAEALRQHRGKVVLVDFWATWCGPCKELFPHTVELHRRLADRGLAVISVSVDDPDNQPAVLKFLTDQGAAFDHYLSKHGTGTETFESFGLRSGVPQYDLYDRQGKLRQSFSGTGEGIDPAKLDAAVEALLAETGK